MKTEIKNSFSFIKNRKIFYIITVSFILIGLIAGGVRGFNYGIDFTGGTLLQINMHKHVDEKDLRESLKKEGIKASITYAGKNNTSAVIKTTTAMNNAKRASVIATLNKDFGVTKKDVQTFEHFGPSVGKMLKHNAVKAIIIADICMLIYIIIRFEWRFGISAIICILHDVLFLVAFYGLFHLQVNNPFIAALLTVIGYSINDTIVVFDRIRENLSLNLKWGLSDLIDTSVKKVLARSLMTSLTTILIIIPVVALGGVTIREFTVPLLVGIAAGTASSIFIASPVYYDLSKRNEKRGRKYVGAKAKK